MPTRYNQSSEAANNTPVTLDDTDQFTSLTEKVTPVSADLLLLEDSAAAGAKRRIQVGNLDNTRFILTDNDGNIIVDDDGNVVVGG